MARLATLFEAEGLAGSGLRLPPGLAEMYGGDFALRRPGLYANFVASVDGVVALAGPGEAGGAISGHDPGDRFIMGLLRAAADAVLIGAGTFAQAQGAVWHPEAVSPGEGPLFAQWRRHLGLRPQPLLVIASASGRLDAAQPALDDALILTTPAGADRLQGRLPAGARIAVLGDGPVGGRALVAFLRTQGLGVILAEGGPTLVGELLGEGLIDELFLTTSPRLYGRSPGDGRKALVEGVDLAGQAMTLLSLRRRASHLYARYALT